MIQEMVMMTMEEIRLTLATTMEDLLAEQKDVQVAG